VFLGGNHLFVWGEAEVGVEAAVAIVTKQNDARLFGSRIENIQVRWMPPGVNRNVKVKVRQHTAVAVVGSLRVYETAQNIYLFQLVSSASVRIVNFDY